MKTLNYFHFFLLILFINPVLGADIDDWEETLRVKLNQLIGSKDYNFQTLEVDPSDKMVSGKGTFFKKKNVAFSLKYDTLQGKAYFEAIMPSNSNVKIDAGQVQSMIGKNVKKMVPEALKKSLYLEKFNFVITKETKEITDFNIVFNALKNWEIFDFSKFSLKEIQTILHIKQPTDSDRRKMEGWILGNTTIGGKIVEFRAQLASRKEDLAFSAEASDIQFLSSLRGLVGDTKLGGISIPEGIFDLTLPQAIFTISPYKDHLQLFAECPLGTIEGYIQEKKKPKKKDNKYEYLITIVPGDQFKPSKIHDKLAILDKIDLSNQKFVFSSEKKSKEEVKKSSLGDRLKSGINKGCSMVANFDLTKIRVDQLIGVKNLVLSSPLTAKLDNMVLQSAIDTEIAIGPTSTLTEVQFQLRPSPKDFSIALLGVMKTQIEDDLLEFKGGVELVLSDQSLNFLAMMEGVWNDPLGAQGLTVADLGIQVGASFTTAPVILPNIALAGKMDIGKFSGELVVAFDTRNPSKSMIAASYNKIILWDLIDMAISNKVKKKIPNGMKKTLRSFYTENVNMEIVPLPVEVLEKYYDAGFRMNGGVSVVGLRGEAAFDLDYNEGMAASGQVDPIEVEIFKFKGAGSNDKPAFNLELKKGKTPILGLNGSVSLLGIQAETDIELLDNGFQFEVGGKVYNLFNSQVKAHGTDLSNAGDIGLRVKLKNDFSDYLEKEVIKIIEQSTSNAVNNLTVAQNNLTKAQNKINNLNKEIKTVRKIVEADQASDRKKINTAKDKVRLAQAKVNNLDKKIKAKQKEYKKLKKHQLVKKSAINTQIATLTASKVTATAALNSAQFILDGMKKLNVNPDTDPKMISLYTSQKAANITLEGAKLYLENLKKRLGFAGDVGTFIIEKGSDALIRVKKASFAGNLGKLHGARVDLDLELEWMKKNHQLTVNYDFNNMKSSLSILAEMLMKKK